VGKRLAGLETLRLNIRKRMPSCLLSANTLLEQLSACAKPTSRVIWGHMGCARHRHRRSRLLMWAYPSDIPPVEIVMPVLRSLQLGLHSCCSIDCSTLEELDIADTKVHFFFGSGGIGGKGGEEKGRLPPGILTVRAAPVLVSDHMHEHHGG